GGELAAGRRRRHHDRPFAHRGPHRGSVPLGVEEVGVDSIVLQVFRIGLLLLLWFFIFMAVRAMYKDVRLAARVRSSAPAAPRRAAVVPGRREAAKQLTVVEGPLKGSHMAVGSLEEVVMGRSPECDFQLGDDFASARHARLFRRGSEWFVEDLDSRNG